MINKLTKLYCAIFTVLSCSCNKEVININSPLDASPVIAQEIVTQKGDTMIVCNTDLINDTIDFPMSLLFSDFEMVKLDDRDDALIDMIAIMNVSSRHLAVYSYYNGIKLFDRQGNYITNVSKMGQGPEDYPYGLDYMYIDEPYNRLYFSTIIGDKIMSFDLGGGSYKPIPLARQKLSNRIKFEIDNKRQRVIVAHGGLYEADEPAYWVQDLDGNMIQQLPAGHLAAVDGGGLNNGLGELFNTSAFDYAIGYWWRENRIDTLYHYDVTSNLMRPVFTANLTSIPTYHLYIELPCHYLIQMGDYGGTLTNYKHILIDKQTLKGSYVRFKFDMLGNLNGQEWLRFRRGIFMKGISPYELLEKWQGSNDFSELPPNMAKFMRYLQTHDTEDMNSVVLIGKLKQSKDEEFVLHDMNFND